MTCAPIRLEFKSHYDGETDWEVRHGAHLLGRVRIRDNVAKWAACPGEKVHWSVLDAIYRERCEKFADAMARFGPGFLQDHDAPQRPVSLY